MNSNNINDNDNGKDDQNVLCDSIYQRRSIRKYKKEEISGENTWKKSLMRRELHRQVKTDSRGNFLYMADEEKKEILKKMRAGIKRELKEPLFKDSKRLLPDADNTLRIMMSAPIVVFVLNTNGVSPMETIDMDGRFTEICDSLSIGAAIENMLLRAQQLGIGSLWIGNTCFAYKELTDYIGRSGQLVGAVALGYPDENPGCKTTQKT